MPRSQSKEFIALCLAITSAAFAPPFVSSASCLLPQHSADVLRQSKRWTLSFSTATTSQLNDSGLSMAPLALSKVLLSQDDDIQVLAYEDLFYANSEPGACVGAKRHCDLSLPARGDVTIDYASVPSDASEIGAAADTIARLLLDVQLKDARVAAVIVPDQCFEEIMQRLNFYGFKQTQLSNNQYDSFLFTLKSQSGTKLTVMRYCR